MHIAALAISIFGTLIALFNLPEPPHIPLWVHGILLLISVAKALTRFGSDEMLAWSASTAITFYWAVIQITGAPLAYMAEVIGLSPKILYMVLYVPLAIVLCLGLFVVAHIVHDRQAPTPSPGGESKVQFNELLGYLRNRMNTRRMKDRSKKTEIEYIDFVIGEIVPRKVIEQAASRKSSTPD